VRLKGLGKLKNPMTSSEIEAAENGKRKSAVFTDVKTTGGEKRNGN
jgi:hypothetical protein